MKCNTEFKILLKDLEISRLFSISHPRTVQYISDCQEILPDTELLNVILLFFMTRN